MCDFINVSAVKKIIHDADRQSSPEFLRALDKSVAALVEKACGAYNGGAKRLDAGLLIAGTGKAAEPEGIRAAYNEAVIMELQVNMIDKKEYLKRIRTIKATIEPLLSAK